MAFNFTQTGAGLQVIVDDASASNVGKVELTDGTDTTTLIKSGFQSQSSSASNAPIAENMVLITAVRDDDAVGTLRYAQIAVSESGRMFWVEDDGGVLGGWNEAQDLGSAQTVAGVKTHSANVILTHNTYLQGQDSGAANENLIGMISDVVTVGDVGHAASVLGTTLAVAPDTTFSGLVNLGSEDLSLTSPVLSSITPTTTVVELSPDNEENVIIYGVTGGNGQMHVLINRSNTYTVTLSYDISGNFQSNMANVVLAENDSVLVAIAAGEAFIVGGTYT